MHRRVLTAVLVTAVLAVPLAASAADYPPSSSGQGTANPSRVKQGQCTNFSGDGFAPDAALTLKDDGVVYGPARANGKGEFRERVCFANDARVGEHVLTAEGADATAGSRRVTATVTVTGVEQTAPASASSTSSTPGQGTSSTTASGAQDLRDAQSAIVIPASTTVPPQGRRLFGVSTDEIATAAGGVLLMVVPLLLMLVLLAERRFRRRRVERLAAA